MGQFDFLGSSRSNKKINYGEYECPYCGAKCSINTTECPRCKNSLVEFEKWNFRNFDLYNMALDCCRNNDYISAFAKVTLFLESYPSDTDGNRLRIFILHFLDYELLDEVIEQYIEQSSDRWAAEFQDDPNSYSVEDFAEKENFEGHIPDLSFLNPEVASIDREKKNVLYLVDVINNMYELYTKCVKLNDRRKNRRTKEFINFYEKAFLKYLHCIDVSVADYLGKDYRRLSKEQQMMFAEVRTVRNRRIKAGTINRVYCPEIIFKNILLQRAVIEIVVPSQKKKSGK